MDFRREIPTIFVLLLVSCLVQVWTISRAVVPAQDCVRYLIVAQELERDGFTATLRTQPEQPLFPALVWLTHRLLPAAGWTSHDDWATSIEVAAAIPLVLSIVPVYLLFLKLHGKRAARLATLIYCLIGGISRLGADGLSDSTHLVLFLSALWCAAGYFGAADPRRPAWLLGCGLFTGLALTARSESLVMPVALTATLMLLACLHLGWQGWKKAAVGAAAFAFGLAIVLTPCLAWCDALTPAAGLARLAGRGGAAEAAPLNEPRSGLRPDVVEPRWELPGMGRLAFGKKDTSTSSRFRGYLSAGWKLLHELAQTLHYWLGALALLGLASRWRQLAAPLDRFMQCLCATLVVVGVVVAARSGYLSTRHVLLLVVLAIGWAGYGSGVLADWLVRTLRLDGSEKGVGSFQPQKSLVVLHPQELPTPFSEQSRLHPRLNVATMIAAVVVFVCGADCFTPLHTSREAHRQAADWLTQHAAPTEAVLDSRGWTALYTGRKTYRYEAAQAAFTDPALRWVVVEQAELAANSRRSETMRLLMGHAGEMAARFAAAGSERHSVVIYHWRPERFQQLGVQTYAR